MRRSTVGRAVSSGFGRRIGYTLAGLAIAALLAIAKKAGLG